MAEEETICKLRSNGRSQVAGRYVVPVSVRQVKGRGERGGAVLFHVFNAKGLRTVMIGLGTKLVR